MERNIIWLLSRMNPLKTDIFFCDSEFRAYALYRQTIQMKNTELQPYLVTRGDRFKTKDTIFTSWLITYLASHYLASYCYLIT